MTVSFPFLVSVFHLNRILTVGFSLACWGARRDFLSKGSGCSRIFSLLCHAHKISPWLWGTPRNFGVRISMMATTLDELTKELKTRLFKDNNGQKSGPPPISVEGKRWRDTQHSKSGHVGVHTYFASFCTLCG